MQVSDITDPSGGLFFVAGPCVLESRSLVLEIAQTLKKIRDAHGFRIVFKGSFDKANRTSYSSPRGPGLKEGLAILSLVKEKTGLPVTTDVHECSQVEAVSAVADIVQIPAFLCRQTDLITEAAKSGRIVNIKKGQFMAPDDMLHTVEKARRYTDKVMVTERGTTFGYHCLINDMAGIQVMRSFGVPVVFDATHSVQRPGSEAGRSGGEPGSIGVLARAAAAAGCDGIFAEVHPSPSLAQSDGANALPLEDAEAFMCILYGLRKYVSSNCHIC